MRVLEISRQMDELLILFAHGLASKEELEQKRAELHAAVAREVA